MLIVSSFSLSLFSVRKLRVSPEGYELRVPSAWLRQTQKTTVGWWWPSHSTSLATPALRLRYLRVFTRGTLCFTAVCGVSFCCSFSFFFFFFFFFFSFLFSLQVLAATDSTRVQADPPPYLCFFLSHRHQGYDVVPHMVILCALYPLPFRFEELPLPFHVLVFQTPETYRNILQLQYR